MSFPIFRDSREWDAVPVAGTNNILATNRRNGKTFSGTLQAFTTFLGHTLDGQGLLAQSAVPIGVANTGTVAANGALTLGTALAVIHPSIWLYLPAAAAYTASPAGIYYCTMTSTTEGTIYNNVLAAGELPYIPSSPTAIVDARGSTAYTGETTIQSLVSVAIPAGLVGPNGSIQISMLGSHNSSAGVKTYTVKGDTATWLAAVPTTTTSTTHEIDVVNRGSAAVNLSRGLTTDGNGTRLYLATAVDTSAAFNVTFNGTLAVATDTLTYEYISVGITPKL